MSSIVDDLLSNGQAAFYRGRQARDLSIRTAQASGMSAEAIAEALGMTEERVLEITSSTDDEIVTPVTPRAGLRGISCAYCLGTGRIDSARACSCRLPNGSCDGTCEDGWIYVYDFCDRCR